MCKINFLSLTLFILTLRFMEDFQKYLSTAPVLLTIWMTFTAGFIIEIKNQNLITNRKQHQKI